MRAHVCQRTGIRGRASSRGATLDDALRTFFEFRKDIRVAAVVELYKTEEMSISKAAELAGVSTEEIKDYLTKAGVKIRRGFSKARGDELARLV